MKFRKFVTPPTLNRDEQLVSTHIHSLSHTMGYEYTYLWLTRALCDNHMTLLLTPICPVLPEALLWQFFVHNGCVNHV